MQKNYLKLLFSLLILVISNTSIAQCLPAATGDYDVEGEFGDNEWVAYVYNYTTAYNNSTFDFSNYRGYYVDAGYGPAGRSFDSSYNWGVNDSPDDTSNYIGCTVTDDNHNVVYKRKGFPTATDYVISIAGINGEAGNDDAAKLFINGALVWSKAACCTASSNVWAGTLDSNSEVEFQWSEGGGASYGRLKVERSMNEDTSFGVNEWNVGCYSDNNFQSYAGSYTQSGFSFNSSSLWAQNSNPSNASTYAGTTIGNDNHSYIYRRTNFDCGYYNIDIVRHDDDIVFIIDGVTVYSKNGWDNNNGQPDIWDGYLDENSEVEIRMREFTGGSILAVNFNYIYGSSNTGEYVWIGETSSDPTDAGNWCGGVPENDGTASIIIKENSANFPFYGSATNLNNMVVEENAEVNLIAGTELNIYGNLENNGTINSSDININFVGGSAQSFSGNGIEVSDFSLNNANGLTLDLNTDEILTIQDVLTVTNGTLTTNNQVLLACNFTNPDKRTAQINDLSNGVISGLITTEQCFPGRRAFRLIASSVNTSTSIRENWQENQNNTGTTFPADNENSNDGYGTHITGSTSGANGFDATPTGNPSMFLFDNANQNWSAIANTNSNTLSVGTPYRLMIRGSRAINVNSNSASTTNTKLRAKGSIAQGEVNQSSFNSTNDSFNLFANPYHAAVNVNALFANAGTANVNTNYYYVYDPTLGGEPIPGVPGGRGAFVTVDLTDGSNSDFSEANQYLQPMQAAFFRTSTVGTTPNLQFTENIKDVLQDQTETLKGAVASNSSSIQISLYNEVAYINNETASDGVKIKFSADGDNALEAKDAPKFGNLDENLARLLDGSIFSIESRNNPVAGEVLSLYTTQYRRSDYVFEINLNNINEVNVYLKDNYLEQSTPLNSGINAITFSVDENIQASIDSDRFEIIFTENNLNEDKFTKEQLVVYPNPLKGGDLQIRLAETSSEVEVSLFNILGKQVYQTTQQPTQKVVSLNDLTLANGIYILKLNTAEGKQYTQKIIKE